MQNLLVSGGNGISFAFYKNKSVNILNKDTGLFLFAYFCTFNYLE